MDICAYVTSLSWYLKLQGWRVCSCGKTDSCLKPHTIIFGYTVEMGEKIAVCLYAGLQHHSLKMNDLELCVSVGLNLRNMMSSKKRSYRRFHTVWYHFYKVWNQGKINGPSSIISKLSYEFTFIFSSLMKTTAKRFILKSINLQGQRNWRGKNSNIVLEAGKQMNRW